MLQWIPSDSRILYKKLSKKSVVLKNVAYLAAFTPSHVVLSLINILSRFIPRSSYSFMNDLAFFTEASQSNDNLKTQK